MSTVSSKRACLSWGSDLPDWVARMAELSDRTSQNQVGKAFGYSGSVVNAILGKRYTGQISEVEKAFRGRFMNEVVNCPVLGEIAANICVEHQRKAVRFSTASTFRVAMTKACRGSCPNSNVGRPKL